MMTADSAVGNKLKRSPLLSIVIVTWNCREDVLRCLDSIKQYSDSISLEIILVDNASSDGTCSSVRTEHPEVIVIENAENEGFPKANNIGFARTQGKLILMLNPDTEITEGVLQACIDFLSQHPEYGCVGVRTMTPWGEVQSHGARRFPTMGSLLAGYLYLDKIFPWRGWNSADIPEWDHRDSRDVDMLQGAFMMFPCTIYAELGGLDTRIPMYLEDGEYCYRIHKAGLKIRYLAEPWITHYVGQSSKKSSPGWISFLRFEANFLLLSEMDGPKTAIWLASFLLLLAPVRLVISPGLAFGKWYRKKGFSLLPLWKETIVGIQWSLRTLCGKKNSVSSR